MKGNMNCYLCNRELVKMIEGDRRWLAITEDMHEMRMYCPDCFEKDYGKPDWEKIAQRSNKTT